MTARRWRTEAATEGLQRVTACPENSPACSMKCRVRGKIREAGLGAVFTAALGERHIFLKMMNTDEHRSGQMVRRGGQGGDTVKSDFPS